MVNVHVVKDESMQSVPLKQVVQEKNMHSAAIKQVVLEEICTLHH